MFSLKFCTAIEWPGAHQHVAAMLQQRVHRHDEEAGEAPTTIRIARDQHVARRRPKRERLRPQREYIASTMTMSPIATPTAGSTAPGAA